AFILRGNLVDLAVAVVIGTAFTAVVTALVRDLITPLIAAIFGEPLFDTLSFSINGSRFAYGDFLNALLTFLIVAAVVFFLVVRPVNYLMARMRTEPDVETVTRGCPECLSQIPVAAAAQQERGRAAPRRGHRAGGAGEEEREVHRGDRGYRRSYR
ncbi:MAG TPA: large conductance mechanosensitive channel protein MscL, partial [Solirubrobacteraceae bacterium]|nr:large conductance mechanosensitive channel protein MscL [Solirubrobacteraceae bacterium]